MTSLHNAVLKLWSLRSSKSGAGSEIHAAEIFSHFLSDWSTASARHLFSSHPNRFFNWLFNWPFPIKFNMGIDLQIFESYAGLLGQGKEYGRSRCPLGLGHEGVRQHLCTALCARSHKELKLEEMSQAGMQQVEATGSIEKRGQQKYRKWRNISHKPRRNHSSLIPLFTVWFVHLFRASLFEMQLDECIFLPSKIHTVCGQTPL